MAHVVDLGGGKISGLNALSSVSRACQGNRDGEYRDQGTEVRGQENGDSRNAVRSKQSSLADVFGGA